MQPGGVRALQQLGLENCAMPDACDSVSVKGYVIINSEVKGKEGEKRKYEHLHKAMLKYPRRDPEGFIEMFGFCPSTDEDSSTCNGRTSKAQSPPQGYGFHHHMFVRELRKAAVAEPNVELIETTVSKLLEENEVSGVFQFCLLFLLFLAVVLLAYECCRRPFYLPLTDWSRVKFRNKNDMQVTGKRIFGVQCSNGKQYTAPLTVVADGIWSGLRKVSNNNKPHYVSSFIGVIVTHPPMEAPVPHRNFGHVILAFPSPILIYQVCMYEFTLYGSFRNLTALTRP